ncbi:helix-turn-helix domain-containing protein [Luteimonas sp. S4-F44]|uniref:helix-turn-helix domain-containing protein n=1 Tax=Luteimonas sp. S4-F44 TaxID=2925842 RepID=UPI001F5391F6|nr:helix-turn-helix domain-containing protein [Luteimonas sp. S4-F44]UNK43439.1 helix-turn-helix domain-containing protein [Luteimonas sp. S4-F44]
MQPWAKRIKEKLDAGKPHGLSQLGLAKACGKSQPSINQWFNDTDSKPATAMIMADNLMAAAKYLRVSPMWIMTGQSDQSQPKRLNADIIRAAARLAETSLVDPHPLDPADPEDAELLALALEAVLEGDTLEASPADAERFVQRVQSGDRVGQGSKDRKDGSTGGAAREKKNGGSARPALGRTRKRA